MKKRNFKIALASTIAVTSAAALIYVTPEIMKTVAVESSENKFLLDVENIDEDTIKVSIDNVEDIPKALQFSIKLDGVVPQKSQDNNEIVIRDLINKEKSESVITDYTYNETDNTIDVLITSNDSITKNENKIEVFELDIEKASENETRNYTVSPKDDSQYKYVSNTNKEYSKPVEVLNKNLSINTAPKITKKEEDKYIEINVGEKLSLTKEKLEEYVTSTDSENDDITFIVKNSENQEIKEFTSTKEGIYDLYITATDTFGGKSETLKVQVKVNQVDKAPEITRNGEELKDITINAGEIFNLMDGIKAVDAIGNPAEVTVKSDKELDLDPAVNTEYNITYTATDSINRKTEKTIKLTVNANTAPVITGVKDHTLTVGDEFDPKAGVEVSDKEDKDLELVVESNVNTKIAGVYRVGYHVTDNGGKTTRAQSVVVVNPKMEAINNIPVISANDVVIQLGEEFNPLNGVTATDVEDGTISTINVVRNEVVKDVAGKYKVTYSATDSKGATATKTITVIVNDPPKINAEDKILKLGQKFDPLSGVNAIDREDSFIKDISVVENNVNINKEGKYKVTYSVVDSLGGKATKTITVTVKSNIVLAESITINNKIDSLYLGSSKILTATVDKKADIKDIQWSISDESVASIEIIGNDVKITPKKVGTVTITAKTKDGSNKSDSMTIKVLNYEDNVIDFIKDIIDTNVMTVVSGNGQVNSPMEMEVKNVTVEDFDIFLSKLKGLDPVLQNKYVDGIYTVYKIKVKNNSLVAKVVNLFNESRNAEGYIELKIANNLDNKDAMMRNLEAILTIEETIPGGDNNQGVETPGTGNGEAGTTTPTEDNANNKKENTKLPITGQESVLGVLGLLAISIGGIIYKKKK